MKNILILFVLLPSLAFAEDFMLKSGESTYTVSHLMKKVRATSKELKGKVACQETQCEFLIAVPVKSYVSSDSNRDENMQMTVESGKFPLATAKGKFDREKFFASGTQTVPAEVTFHGIERTYQVTFKRIDDSTMDADLNLKLTAHKIERPSLFGVSIDDEVPLSFHLVWEKSAAK